MRYSIVSVLVCLTIGIAVLFGTEQIVWETTYSFQWQSKSSSTKHRFKQNDTESDESATTTPSSPSSSSRGPYHSWDSPDGIDLHLLHQYINTSLHDPFRGNDIRSYSDRVLQPLPVLIYERQFWFPQHLMDIATVAKRLLVDTKLIQCFQQALLQQDEQISKHFSTLARYLDNNNATSAVPLILFMGDYTGCSDPAFHKQQRHPRHDDNVPMFTNAYAVGCRSKFPFPTYKTYPMHMDDDALQQNNSTVIAQYNAEKYPWNSKIKKAYWRGACVGTVRQTFHQQVAAAAAADNRSSLDTIFDVPIVCDPSRHHGQHIDPPERPMAYQIALDMDGVSWSERFTRYLCYNSAIVKIVADADADSSADVEMEEYYMVDLIPGVHFIPASVTNVTTVVQQVLEQPEYLQQVAQNANQWCQERILPIQELHYDFQSVLNGYLELLLDRKDAKWKVWQEQYLPELLQQAPVWTNLMGQTRVWNNTQMMMRE